MNTDRTKNTKKTTQTLIQRNYQRLLRLSPDLWQLDVGETLKSHVDGHMSLNVDVLSKKSQRLIIALSHYYQHPCGDMIPDPDMQLYVDGQVGFVEALTYQDSLIYNTVVSADKKRRDQTLRRSLNNFLSQWLKNCLAQGHQLTQAPMNT